MAWENPGFQTAAPAVSSVLVQEARRAFMSRVYAWMFLGLVVTGITGMFTVANKPLMEIAVQWRFGLLLAEVGLVLALSMMAPRLSGPVAAMMFLAYSALTGMTLSVYVLIYTAASIGNAVLLTAGVFGALSLFGTFTKKDLSAWASFLFMGLVGVVLASVVNIFMRSDGLSFVLSCASVVVFAGLTAYDTQKLREMHASTGYSSAASVSIMGALTLYLDLINLFIALLRLFGQRR